MTMSLLSPHSPTPQECTGSAEDDQGKDSRSGTDAGHSPQRSHRWASGTGPLHPSSVPGGTGGWDREADEDSFEECGKEGHFRQRGWVMRRASQGWGVGEGCR